MQNIMKSKEHTGQTTRQRLIREKMASALSEAGQSINSMNNRFEEANLVSYVGLEKRIQEVLK